MSSEQDLAALVKANILEVLESVEHSATAQKFLRAGADDSGAAESIIR
jgi:hypothetical protein